MICGERERVYDLEKDSFSVADEVSVSCFHNDVLWKGSEEDPKDGKLYLKAYGGRAYHY